MGRTANNDARNLLSALEEFEGRLPNALAAGQAGDVGASGERRLMVALLADALGDFRKYVAPRTRREARLLADSAGWLFGEMKGAAVTFEYVCEVLGLNVSAFRSELRRWRDRQHSRACTCEPLRLRTPKRTRTLPTRPPEQPRPWRRVLPTAWPPSALPAVAAG